MNNVSIHTFHLDHKMAMPVGPLRISYCLCSIVLLPLFYWLSLTLLHTDKSVGMFYFLFCWHTLMSCRWGAVHTLQLKSWRNKQQPSSMPTSPQPLTATQPPHVFLFLFCPSGFLILNVDAPSSPATLYSGGNALVHQNTCARTHTHTSLGEQIKALRCSFAQMTGDSALRGEKPANSSLLSPG